jgi:hypothetical protein
MTGAAVTPVEPLRVDRVEPTDPPPETALGSLDQQPVLIGEQAVAVAQPAVLGDFPAEKLQELAAVAVLQEDRLAAITACADMVNGARELNPQRSRHEGNITCRAQKVKATYGHAPVRAPKHRRRARRFLLEMYPQAV